MLPPQPPLIQTMSQTPQIPEILSWLRRAVPQTPQTLQMASSTTLDDIDGVLDIPEAPDNSDPMLVNRDDASDTSDDLDPTLADRDDASDSSHASFRTLADSAISDASTTSSTFPLPPSELTLVWENGRMYPSHSRYQYGLPTDLLEEDRLDMQHHLIKEYVYRGQLYLAPIAQQPQRILDLGCGTGIWPMEIAEEYEFAIVTGVDLGGMLPTHVPRNCFLQVCDIEDEWTFTGGYDFIHARDLVLAIRDWDELFTKVLGQLRPGGYFEVSGVYPKLCSEDNSIPEDSFLQELCGLFSRIGDAMNTPTSAPTTWKSRMETLGFENVKETIERLPIGAWPKDPRYREMGKWEAAIIHSGLEACLMRGYTKSLGGDLKELQIRIAGARHELWNRRIHSYFTYYNVYGQKAKGEYIPAEKL